MLSDKEYISLKEAAKMSGYSSDYVGQLIRAGKIQGKQVFSNVAWVTTEKAILEYIQKEKKSQANAATSSRAREAFFSLRGLTAVYSIVLWITIALLCTFTLFLVYVLAVSIDHRLEQRYLENSNPPVIYE